MTTVLLGGDSQDALQHARGFYFHNNPGVSAEAPRVRQDQQSCHETNLIIVQC